MFAACSLEAVPDCFLAGIVAVVEGCRGVKVRAGFSRIIPLCEKLAYELIPSYLKRPSSIKLVTWFTLSFT